MKSAVCFMIILLSSSLSFARDFSSLYNDAELEAVKTKYERTIREIYDQLILPGLKETEKQVLRRVQFNYVSRTGIEKNGYPFSFYAVNDTVVMPLFALKFLYDLCTAYAWLQVNGYSIETVSEYIGMLKYGLEENFSSGKYPPPLEALHVPEEALSDSQVKELTHLHSTTARAFILAHELAHIVYRHPLHVSGEKRKANEAEADSFALDVLESTGITPLGALVFFLADAHISPKRVDFPDEREFKVYFDKNVTHPLTPDRVQLLAIKMHRLDLEDRNLMNNITELLKDEEIQLSYVLSGEATDKDSLGPRRPKQLLSRVWPRRETQVETSLSFDGFFSGENVRYVSGEQEILPVEVRFERRGNYVIGRYSFGLGQGIIRGKVSANILNFDWKWGRSTGYGILHATQGGTGFSGTWGYRESSVGGGLLKGERIE